MVLIRKKNEDRTPEEIKIIAKNIIILSAVYEEVISFLAKEIKNKRLLFPSIDQKDYLENILGTQRAKVIHLRNMHNLGTVTEEMIKAVHACPDRKAEKVLSDTEVWFDTEEIKSYKWDKLKREEGKRFFSEPIISDIRKIVRQRVINVGTTRDEKKTEDIEIIIQWVYKETIYYYKHDKDADTIINGIMKEVQEIELDTIEGASKDTLSNMKRVCKELNRKVDAVMTYKMYKKK